MVDGGIRRRSAGWLAGEVSSRDTAPTEARLAHQFVLANHARLTAFDVAVDVRYDGRAVAIEFRAGTQVGALPLVSPRTGQPDLGVVIQPRFGWDGIGPVMAASGWRVTPAILALPELKQSERRIPPWVLSAAVLARIGILLRQVTRRFEMLRADAPAPRGTVDWDRYARARMPQGRMLEVPVTVPDLTCDDDLRSGIHYVLLRQRASLETQRAHGTVVMRLLDLCQSLIRQVDDTAARRPLPTLLQAWRRGPLHGPDFGAGIEAMEWTLEERGLAGLSDLRGLPWRMSMDAFFEAWVETAAERMARRMGATLRVGRLGQTIVPLEWSPPSRGTQKSLRPDMVMQVGDHAVVIDAKYKSHWEVLAGHAWSQIGDELRETHRADLLQVLAYSCLANAPRTTVVLAYPCTAEAWRDALRRRRPVYAAAVRSGSREVRALLTAIPLDPRCADEAVDLLTQTLAGASAQHWS